MRLLATMSGVGALALAVLFGPEYVPFVGCDCGSVVEHSDGVGWSVLRATIMLYHIMIGVSLVGLCALIWANIIIDTYDWGEDARPSFHRVYMHKNGPVRGLVRSLFSLSKYYG